MVQFPLSQLELHFHPNPRWRLGGLEFTDLQSSLSRQMVMKMHGGSRLFNEIDKYEIW